MQPLKTAACLLSDQKRKLTDKIRKPGTTLRLFEPIFKLMMRRGGNGGLRSLGSYRRILVIKLDELGDAVIFTPFIRELRRNAPDARITLVVKPQNHNLFELCPYVDEVLSFDWNVPEDERYWRALSFAKQRLWPGRFELAIVPRWDTDSYHASFLAYFSGANIRVGYSEDVIPHKKILNKDFDLLYTHALRDKTLLHEAERNLNLIRYLGGAVRSNLPELWLSKEDGNFADNVLLTRKAAGQGVLIGICPTAGSSLLKQWPPDRFEKLGIWASRELNARVLITGGPNDLAISRELENRIGPSVINVCASTTLRQMAALIKKCAVFISNDAGPMHIAAAIGTPVVAIFGSTCAHRFEPLCSSKKVLRKEIACSPCSGAEHKDRCVTCIYGSPECLNMISVEEVFQAAASLIDKHRSVQTPAS